MKQIAVFGAGGLGREIQMLIEQINRVEERWAFVGFFDDVFAKGTTVNGAEVLGGIDALNVYPHALALVVAIGSPAAKRRVVEKITNTNITFPKLIHPNVQLPNPEYSAIGAGTVIAAGSIVCVNTRIGKHVFLNFGTIVGHDAKIGDFVSVMPSVNINGEVIVGSGAYLGAGAVILNRMEIGEDSVVGAGSVVFNSIPAKCTAIGMPAKPVRTCV